MRKVDDQGASAARAIFRVILIVGIAAGINSVHAENNNNNNNSSGEITVKRIKYLTDHGNPKFVQVESNNNKKSSNEISADKGQGKILPRGLYIDDDDDMDDGQAVADPRDLRFQSCPLCQSTTHKYTRNKGGGSGCSRGGSRSVGSIRAGRDGRIRHFDDDEESDDSDDEDEGPTGLDDENEEDERNAGNRRKGFTVDLADADDFMINFSHGSSSSSDFNPGIPGVGPRRYKTFTGGRGGGMSYGNGRRGKTIGRGSFGYLGSGGNSGRQGYQDDRGIMNTANFRRKFMDDDNDDYDDDEETAYIKNNFLSSKPYSQASFHAYPTSPSVKRRMVLDSSNRNGYMLPNDVIDTVQDLVEDPSMFYVTFACQPKVGKYLCKIQCVKRKEDLTGSCESGYCHCILKTKQKDRKRMNKRFLAATEGFKTDCTTKAKQCKRYCKDLTPDKSFTGLCSNNKCRCVTFPNSPDGKKNACTKAIQKLKKIEDQALRCLGLPATRAGSTANDKLSAATNDFVSKLGSGAVEGCTSEDIQNLRGIISNLAQGLNYAKNTDDKSSLAHSSELDSQEPATPLRSPRAEPMEPGSPTRSPKVNYSLASRALDTDISNSSAALRSTEYYSLGGYHLG